MSNIWHLVLSTGFPRAPLGIESKIHWQTQLLSIQEGEPQRLLPTEAALCNQTVGHSRLSGQGSSFSPPRTTTSRTLSTGSSTWLPFSSSKMASSIIYWATCGGHRAEILPEPLLHLGVDDASQCFNNPPHPTPCCTLPPFPGLSLPPVLMSQWDLSKFLPAASALHRPILVLISFQLLLFYSHSSKSPRP